MITDDQFRAMQALMPLQSAALEAGTEADRRQSAAEPGADAAYQEYYTRARPFLAALLALNEQWPSSLAVEPVVQALVNTLLRHADYVQAAGDRQRASAYRQEALALTDHHLEPLAAANVRRGQASQLASEGRFNDALITLDAARRTFLDAGDEITGAQAALDVAAIHEWLGDFDRALNALTAVRDRMAGGGPTQAEVLAAVKEQMMAIAEGRQSSAGVDAVARQRIAFELIGHEARIRLKKADYPAAERLFEQVLPHALDGGFGEGIEFQLAVAAMHQGRVSEAGAIVARIAPAFDQGQFRLRRSALRMVESDIHLCEGAASGALASAEAGIVDLETYPDVDLAWKLHLRRGRALRALDRPHDALAAFVAATQNVDDLRKGSLGYRLDSTFLTDKLPLFDEAIDLAAERDAGAAAVGLIELVKSRALAATLSIPPRARRERTPDELRFDELAARLDALEYLDASGSATPESKRERITLLAERRDVAERLRIADPRWRTLSEPLGFDLDAVLALLAQDDRAALTLYHRPGRMVAVLLHGGRCTVARRAIDDHTEATLRAYTENLQSWEPDEALFDISAHTGIGWEHLIPAELQEEALGASTLLVVPHRTLHLLPWAGLRVHGRRLFEHTTVGVLPNLTGLAVLDGESAPVAGVALIGDPAYSGLRRYPPLPQAGAEIDDIAAIHAEHLLARPVRGADATEAAFWTLAGRRDATNAVLHVACHATLEAGEPLTSGLLMTDAKVDAGEIALRRITYPEVVLSACSTAWRPDRAETLPLSGDDALGLVASFLEAGARFVLAGVPPALDDAARAFAVAWHRHRRAGSSPLAAVRATQLELAVRAELPAWSWVGITGYGCR